MPRNDRKAYRTLQARIPHDLATEVERYATQHDCSVSTLIKQGLEMRLVAALGRAPLYQEAPSPELIREWIEDSAVTAASEVLKGLSLAFPQPQGTPQRGGITEVLPQKSAKRRAGSL